MEKLKQYLNSLTKEQQASFAKSCKTTIGYLRTAISDQRTFKTKLAIAIEKQSAGVVRVEDIVPEADWSFIRKNK